MWKVIPGYEGYYEVSDEGEVRSVDRVVTARNGVNYRRKGRLMKQSITKTIRENDTGYFVVNLHVQHRSSVMPVHRLVAETFIPNPLNLPTINHADGNKLNNDVSNLEWASYSDNNTHALENHLRFPRSNPVAQKSLSGQMVATYRSVSEAARRTGISRGMISHCIHNRAHTAGGYVWEKLSEGVTTIPYGSTPGDELPAEAQERLKPKI